MDTAEATEGAIRRVVKHFQDSPGSYFTEEDVRWRVMKEIEASLAAVGASEVTLKDRTTTSVVHGEYPTPFRCSMKGAQFDLSPSSDKKRRGHYDVVVLDPSAAVELDFKEARFQDFESSLEAIRGLKRPLMDSVIEIMLLRTLAYRKRKTSIQNEAEAAVQDILKVASALTAQPEYYPSAPFARRGYMLLFNNSHLTVGADVKEVWQALLKELCERLEKESVTCQPVDEGFTIEALPLRIITSYATSS